MATLTEGSCLIQSLATEHDDPSSFTPRAWLTFDAGVGERQRFHLTSAAPSSPNDAPEAAPITLPAWPAGPWSGATLTPLAALPSDVPLPALAEGLRAWRLPLSIDVDPPEPLALSLQPQE